MVVESEGEILPELGRTDTLIADVLLLVVSPTLILPVESGSSFSSFAPLDEPSA